MSHENREPVALAISRPSLRGLALVALACLLLWYAGDVLLVAFAGVLVGVILHAAAEWVRDRTKLGWRTAYLIVLAAILALAVAAAMLLGPRIIDQAGEIADTIPQSVATIVQKLNGYGWGRTMHSFLMSGLSSMNLGAKISGLAASLLNELTLVLIALVVGAFLGADPAPYRRGLLKFVRPEQRPKAQALFERIAYTLRWWLLGQFVPMGVLGIGAFIGLSILGVPLAFTLALFTALMLFIPYIGSLISLIPAALVGLVRGPQTMLWVIVLFLGVHALEGYLITPLAQRRAIRLPPVVTILSQLLMWSLAGLLGLIIATPLAATVIVAVDVLYFHENPSEAGE